MNAEPSEEARDPRTIRLAVVRAARILSYEGLVQAFGHVSARLTATRFVVTPRKGLTVVSADELLQIEVADGTDPGLAHVGGDAESLPVEAVMHAAVYVARPDVEGIARVHGEASTVFGVSGASLRPVHALGAAVPETVPVLDSSDLVAGWPAGIELSRVLGDGSALLLRGNGQLVVGGSVEEACARAILLEESARIQLAARSAGFDPQALTAEERDRAVRDIANPRQIRRVWDHYCTKHGLLDLQ